MTDSKNNLHPLVRFWPVLVGVAAGLAVRPWISDWTETGKWIAVVLFAAVGLLITLWAIRGSTKPGTAG